MGFGGVMNNQLLKDLCPKCSALMLYVRRIDFYDIETDTYHTRLDWYNGTKQHSAESKSTRLHDNDITNTIRELLNLVKKEEGTINGSIPLKIPVGARQAIQKINIPKKILRDYV